MSSPLASRRQLLAGAALGTATIGWLGAPVAQAQQPPAPTAAQVLAGLLSVELLLIFAYRQALATAPLSSGVRQLAELLLSQEGVHAARLSAELTRLGAAPPSPPADVATADRQLQTHSQVPVTLVKAKTEHDWLRLLVGLERVAEGAYYLSMATLSESDQLRLSAEILASDAQHAAWLGDHLHHGDISMAVPDAFVQGIP